MTVGSVVQVLYDGQDITSNVMFADASFEAQMNAIPGTFSFRCKDPTQSLSFTTGREVKLIIDGTPTYSGYLTSVARGYAFPAQSVGVTPSTFKNRIWQLQGVDYNVLFDKRVVRQTTNYLTQIPTLAVGAIDGDIIRSLVATYLDAPSTLSTALVENVYTFITKYAWKQQGSKWRESMDELAAFSGALWYIDALQRLRYQAIDTTVKRWGFSDKPNNLTITTSPVTYQGTTIGMREIEGTEDGSFFVNDAFVWGGSQWAGAGGTVFSRSQDAAQIAAHNRWQMAETHFGEQGYGIQAGVNTRSDIIVNGPPGAVAGDQNRGLKYPQWQFRLGWFAHNVPLLSGVHDHIVPGELATFTLWVFSQDGGSSPLTQLLPMRSVRITFPNLDPTGKGYVRFDGMFGLQPDDPYTLWRFILKTQQQITQVVNGVVATVNDSSTSAPYGAYGIFTPTPAPNGSTTVFSIPFPYISGTTQLYHNGLIQRLGTDYTESNPSIGQITLTSAPLTGHNLLLTCRTA